VRETSSQSSSYPSGKRYVVSTAFDPAVASYADVRRGRVDVVGDNDGEGRALGAHVRVAGSTDSDSDKRGRREPPFSWVRLNQRVMRESSRQPGYVLTHLDMSEVRLSQRTHGNTLLCRLLGQNTLRPSLGQLRPAPQQL
jgi:hypothetical protein